MKTNFTVSLTMIFTLVLTFSNFAQDYSSELNKIPEHNLTITQSVDPDSIFANGSLACRQAETNFTGKNSYWRSFVLSDFGMTDGFSVTSVDIGIQQAFAGNGGVQPLTCNLFITDGTPFPNGFPTSLTLIGTATMDVPDQTVSHFSIHVTGVAPGGSELVVEISVPLGIIEKNIFFIGINDFGETAPSYILADSCGFSNPVPPPNGTGIPEQHYVMSVTGDMGVTSIEDDNKSSMTFKLNQNYPNPFNPTTKIKYQIPTGGIVSLKVYDDLGREVTALVNEEKPTGSYVVEFDASNLASGVYFYKLQAENFIQTKKMILLR